MNKVTRRGVYGSICFVSWIVLTWLILLGRVTSASNGFGIIVAVIWCILFILWVASLEPHEEKNDVQEEK